MNAHLLVDAGYLLNTFAVRGKYLDVSQFLDYVLRPKALFDEDVVFTDATLCVGYPPNIPEFDKQRRSLYGISQAWAAYSPICHVAEVKAAIGHRDRERANPYCNTSAVIALESLRYDVDTTVICFGSAELVPVLKELKDDGQTIKLLTTEDRPTYNKWYESYLTEIRYIDGLFEEAKTITRSTNGETNK